MLDADVTVLGVSVRLRESNPQTLPSRHQGAAEAACNFWAVAAPALAASIAATDSCYSLASISSTVQFADWISTSRFRWSRASASICLRTSATSNVRTSLISDLE